MLLFHDVSFFYPSSIHPVLENISVEFHNGWTGVTGDNGAGKTTFLMLAAGLLKPHGGTVSGTGGLYCPQRTDDLPDLWEDFFSSGDTGHLMSLLGIGADWPYRWETLSHGERKTATAGEKSTSQGFPAKTGRRRIFTSAWKAGSTAWTRLWLLFPKPENENWGSAPKRHGPK